MHGAPAGRHRGLQRQQVVHGFDDEQIDTAVEQPAGERLVGVAQFGVSNLAERSELGARPDGPGDIAAPVGRRVVGGDACCDRPGGVGQLVGALRDPVLGEGYGECPEGVCLGDIRANIEVAGVELGNDVGAGDVEDLVAAGKVGPAEVILGEVGPLQCGAGGAVVHDDALVESLEKVHQDFPPISSLFIASTSSSVTSTRFPRAPRAEVRCGQLIDQALAPG